MVQNAEERKQSRAKNKCPLLGCLPATPLLFLEAILVSSSTWVLAVLCLNKHMENFRASSAESFPVFRACPHAFSHLNFSANTPNAWKKFVDKLHACPLHMIHPGSWDEDWHLTSGKYVEHLFSFSVALFNKVWPFSCKLLLYLHPFGKIWSQNAPWALSHKLQIKWISTWWGRLKKKKKEVILEFPFTCTFLPSFAGLRCQLYVAMVRRRTCGSPLADAATVLAWGPCRQPLATF